MARKHRAMQHSAQRTLVKSPPELWAEVSDPDALSRHLDEFGEIRITRLEPEATVAWEGDRARGTVRPRALRVGHEGDPDGRCRERARRSRKLARRRPSRRAEPGARAGAGAGARARAGAGRGRRPSPSEPEPEPSREAEAEPAPPGRASSPGRSRGGSARPPSREPEPEPEPVAQEPEPVDARA